MEWLFLAVLAVIGVSAGTGAVVAYNLVARGRLGLRVAALEAEVEDLKQGRAEPLAPEKAETTATPSGSRPSAEPPAGEGSVAARETAESAAETHRPAPPAPADAEDSGADRAGAAAGAKDAWARGRRAASARSTRASIFERIVERVRTGNTAAQIGAIVLFFGVAFLLKFVSDQGLLPIQLRLSGAAIGGIAVLVWGWRLRRRLPDYALAVQGAGLGILYLTTFTAVALYQALPSGLAFLVLVGLTAGAVIMAVVQDAFWLAALAVTGGFLAPVLTASGDGSHVLLFSYFLLLNIGILAVAWFRAWRGLNLIGFGFTFTLGLLWGGQAYRPAMLASVEPFLIAHVLLYTGVSVLFALRQPPRLRGLVDGTLVFGTPVVGLGLQAGLVASVPYGMAISAAVVGLFYTSLAWWVWRRLGSDLGPLAEAYLGVGVAAATLAIPLSVGGRWTAAAWALEGAGIVWFALRQAQRLPLIAGFALQLLAAGAFLSSITRYEAAVPVANTVFMGYALLALAGWFTAWQIHRRAPLPDARQRLLAAAVLAWGTFWWLAGIGTELRVHVATNWWINTGVVAVTATAVVAGWLARPLAWRQLGVLSAGLLTGVGAAVPVTVIPYLDGLSVSPHPLGQLGVLIWPAVLLAHYAVLRRLRATLSDNALGWLHAGGGWVAVYWVALEAAWLVAQASHGAWAVATLGAVPTLAFWGLFRVAGPRRKASSLARHYLDRAGGALAGFLTIWLIVAGVGSRGEPWPLVFVPLFNPLELAVVGALLALLRLEYLSRHAAWRGLLPTRRYLGALGGLAFALFSVAIARCVHHWAGVAYGLPELLGSTILQASLSLTWGATALGIMWAGHKRGWRKAWTIGAALCAVVVVKLFIVDLANTATLARIVSFIGVGLLLLAVGYLAPVPPRAGSDEEAG